MLEVQVVRSRIQVGRVWSIPIGLHPSWFLIFLLITVSLSLGYFPAEYPSFSPLVYWLLGGATSALFFVSVLFHELAHAFVAIRNRIPVRGITLFIFGGVAQIEEEPRTPGAEFRLAIAGPLASLMLALLFGSLYRLDPHEGALAALSEWLARINFMLALFNMIPGFPLDGGRVLRAAVWKLSGSAHRATRVAATVGQVVAWGFAAWGMLAVLLGDIFNGLWLIFIGWFLHSAASSSTTQAGLREALQGVTVGQVMIRNCAYVSHDISIKKLMEENIVGAGQRCFFVNSDGKTEGAILLKDVHSVPHSEWPTVTAGEIMVPWKSGTGVNPSTELIAALQLMGQEDITRLPVVENGRTVGMLLRDQVLQFIRWRAQAGL